MLSHELAILRAACKYYLVYLNLNLVYLNLSSGIFESVSLVYLGLNLQP